MKHKLIEQRLKQVIIDLGNEIDANLSALTPDDIIYIFNENKLFIVDSENPLPNNGIKLLQTHLNALSVLLKPLIECKGTGKPISASKAINILYKWDQARKD